MPEKPLTSSRCAAWTGRPSARLVPRPISSSGVLWATAQATVSTSAAASGGLIVSMGSEPRQVGETRGTVMDVHASELGTAPELREHFARIEQLFRIEGAFQAHLLVEIGLVEHHRHEVALLDADAMLAGQDTADLDAERLDL